MKKGDKIRVISNRGNERYFKVGDEGVILESYGLCEVQFEHDIWTISEDDMEVIEDYVEEFYFFEAFKAYENGKEIESIETGTGYKKVDGMDLMFDFMEGKWYRQKHFELDEIRNKWYIRD